MAVYRFLARHWVYIEGKDLDDVTKKFGGVEIDYPATADNQVVQSMEFHSVQTVEVENGKGNYESVDKPLRGGDI